ncbi:MAG: class I SAM-dependent methyltransferase [Myxococcaceae bacterium]
MDARVRELLSEYERRSAEEWKLMSTLSNAEIGKRIDEFLISVGPDTGQLLHALVRSQKAKCVVELGCSYGYSTVWLADAVRETGGKLHSYELSADKIAFTRGKLATVGLDSFVEFHPGDALQNLPQLAGPIDLALIDCWKDLYLACFDLVHPKLSPQGTVVADNMIFPPDARPEAARYQRHVRATKGIESVTLPIGSGIDVSRKQPLS